MATSTKPVGTTSKKPGKPAKNNQIKRPHQTQTSGYDQQEGS
ncbi:hypothetical protein [Paraflavitalea speifideaquila]|nr:hypothetical protein [Paraflavitalea speifideiaquila]